MFENNTYLLPLLGIILGWFLTELSFHFRQSREDKRIIRSIIYNLFDLKLRLDQMKPIIKEALESDLTDKSNEIIITTLLKNEKTEFSIILKDLKGSIKTISSYSPFVALELNTVLNESMYFSEFLEPNNLDKFKKHLELELKKCKTYSKYLKKIIKKLLWKTDKIYLIKFLIRDHKENKENSEPLNWFTK